MICWRSSISFAFHFGTTLFIRSVLQQLDHTEDWGKANYNFIVLVNNVNSTTHNNIGSLKICQMLKMTQLFFYYFSFHSLCFVHTSHWKQRMERGKICIHRCINLLSILEAGCLPLQQRACHSLFIRVFKT